MQLFGTKGQKFLHCPKTKGRRNELKILPEARTAYQNLGRDKTRDNQYFSVKIREGTGFPVFSCFRTSFPVLEHLLTVLERLFPFFFFFWESDFVPGQKSLSQDFFSCICPGTKGQRDKELFLSRDKGTTGRPILDCPGTSFGTSNSGLSRDVLRDVLSLENPTLY